jgi:hypothetical protein
VAALGEGQLYRHKWEWTNGTWLPYYRYLPVHSITDVWTEWSSGLDGHLPVRELEEQWGPKWRRNVPSQRTENGRRKKIVELVASLSNQRRWGIALALRFLRETYEPTHKPRAFTNYLTKHRDVVVARAASYP